MLNHLSFWHSYNIRFCQIHTENRKPWTWGQPRKNREADLSNKNGLTVWCLCRQSWSKVFGNFTFLLSNGLGLFFPLPTPNTMLILFLTQLSCNISTLFRRSRNWKTNKWSIQLWLFLLSWCVPRTFGHSAQDCWFNQPTADAMLE